MLLQMLTLKRGCLIAILLFVLWILILGVWMLVGPTMTSAHRLTVYTGSNFANNVHITAYASDHSSKDSTFGWKLSHDPHVVPSLLRLFNKGDDTDRKLAVGIAQDTLRFGQLSASDFTVYGAGYKEHISLYWLVHFARTNSYMIAF